MTSNLLPTLSRSFRTFARPTSLLAQSPARYAGMAGWNGRRLYATGGVSAKPGSETLSALTENAKHEIKQTVGHVKEAIAGDNTKAHGGKSTLFSDFDSITALAEKVPNGAIIYGAAGLIPYAATSFASVYLTKQAGSPSGTFDMDTAMALLHHVEVLQIGYGALILSFLGGIHWGFEWMDPKGDHARYLIGIFPVLVGWTSLLLTSVPQIALLTQLGGFFAIWAGDQRLTAMGWCPKFYSTYRFILSAVVGGSIMATLIGGAYYKPEPVQKALKVQSGEARAAMKAKNDVNSNSALLGEIKIERGDEGFVKFSNPEKIKEEKAAKEKAEEEKAEKAKKEKESLEERIIGDLKGVPREDK